MVDLTYPSPRASPRARRRAPSPDVACGLKRSGAHTESHRQRLAGSLVHLLNSPHAVRISCLPARLQACGRRRRCKCPKTPIMNDPSCSSQSVRCAASWSGGVGAPARPSSPAGLCRSWPPGGVPCPLLRPPPEVAVSPFVAPTRPAARRLRRAPEAAAAADERLRAGGRPTPAMGPPRRRKVGRGEARRRLE